MAKSVHDDVLDAALNYIKNNATRMTACSAEPTSYAEANATYALADVTLDSGDFSLGNGDASGRKVTVAAQSDVLVDTTGDATHVALLDVSNSKLLAVATCDTETLTQNDYVNFPAWDIELAEPT